MRKTIICLLSCMLLILGALQLPLSGRVTQTTIKTSGYTTQPTQEFLDVTFTAGQYSLLTHTNGDSEIIMDEYGNLLVSGAPMLPTKIFFVGLPPGCAVKSIELLAESITELPGVYHIRQSLSVGNEYGSIEVKTATTQTPSSSGMYPPSFYDYLGMSHMRKYALARIQFSPFSYFPETGALLLHQSITLRIYYTCVEDVSPVLLSDTAFDDIAAQSIYNYEAISEYYHTTKPMRQPYDYVIITTSSLVMSLNGFMTWKQLAGFSVNIVTLTWILANYPATDTQKSIRDFLIANYAAWGIKYVLIVGTHASIPMRICYPDPTNHNNDGTHDIPTDYYYADLTGNWDNDSDGFYGERGQDNPDFTPEVYVGRIPTDGSGAVSSITLKIQQFEQTAYTGWKKNAMLLGAVYSYASEDHTTNPRWDGADVMEQCRNNLLSGFSTTTMYEKQGLSPCAYPCTFPLNNPNIIGQWGSTTGWGIVNWAAHGAATSANQKVWTWDDGDTIPETLVPGEIIYPIMIQSIDNGFLNNSKPPIVFAASCLVSRPETGNNLGISLLVNGASAFIGATRTSWGSIGWTIPAHGGHGTVCYDFTDRIAKKNEDCGHALFNAKQYVYNNIPWNVWQDEANMYNFNLYGDPSMAMNLPPGAPNTPSGPTSGINGISYQYSTSCTDPTGDKIKYGWDWNGDGTVDQWDNNNGNYYASGQMVSMTHTFNTAGTYNVQVKAEDIYGRQGSFSPILLVVISQNQPPSKPVKPSGTTSGKTGTTYPYTTSATDPESYTVAYGWDWNGDGTVDQWDDNSGSYYPSGQTITTSHSWTTKGTYTIKVKAKDIHGNEGPWSDPLAVTMPFSYQLPILNFFERLFQWFPNSFPLLRNLMNA
ncbi:MAG: hypothetical protein JW840_01370 [Candidatus Thermoplasmatota archaeon]|nr:hypothetical protein [Candidatus Thermoplasmatota archaeon]